MRIWPSIVLALSLHGLLFALPFKEPSRDRLEPDQISFVLVNPIDAPADNHGPAPFSEPLPEPEKILDPEPIPEPEPVPAPEPESRPEPEPKPRPVPLPEPKPEVKTEPEPGPDQTELPQVAAPDPEPTPISPSLGRITPPEQPGPVQKDPLPAGPVQTAFGEPEGPRFKQRVIPEYPMRARRMGREGVVGLKLHIDELGNLVEAEIIEKAGYGLDEAALKAVQQSTYYPASRNGQPVESRARLNIRFELR